MADLVDLEDKLKWSDVAEGAAAWTELRNANGSCISSIFTLLYGKVPGWASKYEYGVVSDIWDAPPG
jgi:hypothetical protein